MKAAGIDISMKRLLAELDEIKEIIVLYPCKRGAKSDPQHTVLSKTSELQQSWLSILDVQPEETAPLGDKTPSISTYFNSYYRLVFP